MNENVSFCCSILNIASNFHRSNNQCVLYEKVFMFVNDSKQYFFKNVLSFVFDWMETFPIKKVSMPRLLCSMN